MMGAANINDLMANILAGWAEQQGGDPKKEQAPAKKGAQQPAAQKTMYVPGMGTTPIVRQAMGSPAAKFDFGYTVTPGMPGAAMYLDPSGRHGEATTKSGVRPSVAIEQLAATGLGAPADKKAKINIGDALQEKYREGSSESLMNWLSALPAMSYVNMNAGIPANRTTNAKQRLDPTSVYGGVFDAESGNAYFNVPIIQRALRGVPVVDVEEYRTLWRDHADSQQGAVLKANALNDIYSILGRTAPYHEPVHGYTSNLSPSYSARLDDMMLRMFPGATVAPAPSLGVSPTLPGAEDVGSFGYLTGHKDVDGTSVRIDPQMANTEAIAFTTDISGLAGHPMQHAAQIYEKENKGKKFRDLTPEMQAEYYKRGFDAFKNNAKKIPFRVGPHKLLQDRLKSGKGDEWFYEILKEWAANNQGARDGYVA